MTVDGGQDRQIRIHTAAPPLRSLVPQERDVVTGRFVDSDRADKHRRDEPRDHPGRVAPRQPAPSQGTSARGRPRIRRRTLSTVGAGVAAAAVITTVFLVTDRGDPTPDAAAPAAAATSTAASLSRAPLSSTGASASHPAGTTIASPPPTSSAAPSSRISASGPSTTGSSPKVSPSTRAGRTSAALDPATITAYRARATYTRYERPKAWGTGHPAVGDVEEYFYPCQHGTCQFYFGPPGTTFPATAPKFSGRWAPVTPGTGPSPCDIVFSWSFVRQPDSSYVGTVIAQPKKIEARYPGGSCRAYAATQRIVMVPVTG